jgi:hypothetical protein
MPKSFSNWKAAPCPHPLRTLETGFSTTAFSIFSGHWFPTVGCNVRGESGEAADARELRPPEGKAMMIRYPITKHIRKNAVPQASAIRKSNSSSRGLVRGFEHKTTIPMPQRIVIANRITIARVENLGLAAQKTTLLVTYGVSGMDIDQSSRA